MGVAYLYSYLRSKGHEPCVFDLNIIMEVPYEGREDYWGDILFVRKFALNKSNLLESLADKILESGAEIIGFSVWVTTKYISLALARIIKQKDKNRLIVFGGPECSFSGQELIANDDVDIVVCGEGEETLSEIVELYGKYKKVGFCLGCLIKDNNNIIDCGTREEIKDLNSLPFPDFSGFTLDKYYLANNLPITFYRGCLRRCVFCNTVLTWRRFRSRTAENIYNEMKHKKHLYPGLEKFEVDDTALNLDLKMISRLCELIIGGGLRVSWGGSAIIDPDMVAGLLRKMAFAGCTSMAFGLESGSQRVIDKMKKAFKIEDAERVIRATYEAGINVEINIIIGFPNEGEREFRETIDFIERNKNYISFVSLPPSECWIGNQTYVNTNPREFNVELNSQGPHLWKTIDGLNTHEVRKNRIKIFNDLIGSFGLRFHNYATFVASEKEIDTI